MWRRIVSSGLKTLAADVAVASPSRRWIAGSARPVGFYLTAGRSPASFITRHFSSEPGEINLAYSLFRLSDLGFGFHVWLIDSVPNSTDLECIEGGEKTVITLLNFQ